MSFLADILKRLFGAPAEPLGTDDANTGANDRGTLCHEAGIVGFDAEAKLCKQILNSLSPQKPAMVCLGCADDAYIHSNFKYTRLLVEPVKFNMKARLPLKNSRIYPWVVDCVLHNDVKKIYFVDNAFMDRLKTHPKLIDVAELFTLVQIKAPPGSPSHA